MNDDIVSLQIQMSYFEEQLAEMNKVIYEQQLTIDSYEKVIRELNNKVQQIGSSQVGDQSEEAPPPHY